MSRKLIKKEREEGYLREMLGGSQKHGNRLDEKDESGGGSGGNCYKGAGGENFERDGGGKAKTWGKIGEGRLKWW